MKTKLLWIGFLLLGAFVVVNWLRPDTFSFITHINDHSIYYRVQSAYLHDGERVEFDIVVGCAVRVTTYGDASSSWDAFRYPTNYVKATKDGGAVWQIVPTACEGQTTENGKVPSDFMPGAIWFDDKNDLSLGIAYVLEDAYENPKSKLKFLGASIRKATRAEFDAFQPIAKQNLIDPKQFTVVTPSPSSAEMAAHMWDKKEWMKRELGFFSCHGVKRFKLTDPKARETLRAYWPASHPRFWRPKNDIVSGTLRIDANAWGVNAQVGDHKESDFVSFYPPSDGFPTRSGGGRIGYQEFPTEVYPVIQSDSVPWFGPDLLTASTIYRDIDMAAGANRGFAYCYIPMRTLTSYWGLYVPNYFDRHFATRVDGLPVVMDGPLGMAPDVPNVFFENDEYFYERFDFTMY